MKKIINGKKYDTDTAKCLLTWDNGCTGFSYCMEALYQKKTGEFFLFGKGGPMSRYAIHYNNNYITGGEQIRPFTEQQARNWTENLFDGDDYEAIFGEVEE